MAPKLDLKRIERKIKGLNAKHALATGRAVAAWNVLHNTLGTAFAEILHSTSHKMANAIWHSQDSDRNQRKMLLAAAKVEFGEDARLFHDIKFICDALTRISEERNIMVHVAYGADAIDQTFQEFKLKPQGAGHFGLPDKWQNRDVLAQIDALNENTVNLLIFTMELLAIIPFQEQFPKPKPKAKPDDLPLAWPRRPSVLTAAVPPTPRTDSHQPPKK